MLSVFTQRNLHIPTRRPIQIGFRWLNHQVHQWSQLNCKPIHLVIHPNPTLQKRGSDHFWWNSFPCLRNPQTDQFLWSLLLSSSGGKLVNSISHPLLSDSIHRRAAREGKLSHQESQQVQCSRVWRTRLQYLSHLLQISHKQASSFSSLGHRSALFYFYCIFNVWKLGRASQTIESVYNTHCDFDGYFYRKKKCALYTGKYGTCTISVTVDLWFCVHFHTWWIKVCSHLVKCGMI